MQLMQDIIVTRLFEWRRERGLTCKDVGNMLQISESQMNRIENHKSTPSPPVVVKIVDLLQKKDEHYNTFHS